MQMEGFVFRASSLEAGSTAVFSLCVEKPGAGKSSTG